VSSLCQSKSRFLSDLCVGAMLLRWCRARSISSQCIFTEVLVGKFLECVTVFLERGCLLGVQSLAADLFYFPFEIGCGKSPIDSVQCSTKFRVGLLAPLLGFAIKLALVGIQTPPPTNRIADRSPIITLEVFMAARLPSDLSRECL
jgi:hypothetical protein